MGGRQIGCCNAEHGFVCLLARIALLLWLEMARQRLSVDYAQPFFEYVPCSGGCGPDMRFDSGIGCAG